MSEQAIVKCGWGDTKATLQYEIEGVFHWKATDGFRFITHDLKDVRFLK